MERQEVDHHAAPAEVTLARCPSGIFAMTLTLPTIHNNGTSPEDLAKGFLDGMRAISAAADLLCNAGPNGRDYYPQGSEALPAAITEHRSRLVRLEAIRLELETLAVHCSDAAHELDAARARRMAA